jgi:hypothetical protein
VKAQLIKEIVPGAMGNSIDNPEDRDWKRLMFYQGAYIEGGETAIGAPIDV